MNWIDEKFRQDIYPYIIQCGLATVTMVIVLLFLDVILHSAIIATLGSTAFTVFAMPHSYAAKTRPLLGGYLTAALVGIGCIGLFHLAQLVLSPDFQRPMLILFGSIAVGLAIFLMVALNFEHPPATGLSLALVLNAWDIRTILFVFGAVLLLVLARRLLKASLVDLV